MPFSLIRAAEDISNWNCGKFKKWGIVLKVRNSGYYWKLSKHSDQAKQLEEPMQQMAQYLRQIVAKEQQMQEAAQAPVEGGYA
jgi:hypothetical protein